MGALAALCAAMPAAAQEATGTIRGHVLVDSVLTPLGGVSVSFHGRRAVTQADGSYTISGAPAVTDTLRARLIGYVPAIQLVTVTAGQTDSVDFTMRTAAVQLSTLVVTGYGAQRAGNITGAVTQVGAEDFNPGRVISPANLIQNKVPGVQVVDNNEPGGGLSIRIRGTTSINASSEPLYVLDGVPLGTGSGGGLSAGRDPLNFLNPDDIASFTVLRDASSASIYGSNAANGVVLIETKSGQGKSHVEYSTSMSSSAVTRLPSMLTASEFAAAVQQYAPQNANQLQNFDTNWFGLVDRTAFGQDHNLSVAGSSGASNYRMSLEYLDQDGIIRGTNTQRIAAGMNFTQHLLANNLTVTANFHGSRDVDQFTPGGVLSNAAQFGPTQPVYDTSSVTGFYNWPGLSIQSADNPLEILALATDQGTTYRSVGNVLGEYRMPFLPALKGTVNLGYDVTKADRETFNSGLLHNQEASGTDGTDYRADNTAVNSVLEAYGDYAAPLKFAPGNIDITAGYSYAQYHAVYPYTSLSGLSTSLLGVNGFPSARTVQNGLDIEDSRLISFFGRATYNYADRYLVDASVRRDGSSRFGPSNAWGTFPAVSVGWRLSREPFMRGLTGLSDLKLRGSWARTGNQSFANYQQYAAYTESNAQAEAQFGDSFVSTIRPSAVDPNIKWEATTSWDAGLDYGFAHERFTGSVDWYTKTTNDLIFTVPVAAGTNFSNFLTTNIGSMRNRGIELNLDAQILRGGSHGLNWTANFNASHNANEILSINPYGGAVQQILVGGVAGGVGTTIQVLEPGQPINSFFVCQQAYSGGKPVDGKYVSLVGDSVVSGCSNADRRAYHDPSPKWIFGHTSYFGVGKFDFSFTLRAYLGNYVYNNVASNLGDYAELTRGSPYNLQSSVLTTGFTEPQYLSDYYVESGSFLRMDNITLGYSFHYLGEPLRLYATAQNVFTITGYSGVDPTAGLNGIDNNIYPRSRIITGGLSVRF
jgi:iron complex outermembrane receptor protein